MPSPDNCNHYVKLYFCLTPEHLSLGNEWRKKFVKLQLQEGFIRALEDLENEWPRIIKDCVPPPPKKQAERVKPLFGVSPDFAAGLARTHTREEGIQIAQIWMKRRS